MSADQANRAVLRNLHCEHRITPERLALFEEVLMTLKGDIQRALGVYKYSQVVPAKGGTPAYELAENRNNSAYPFLAGQALGSVLDLTGLGAVYAEAKAQRIPEFLNFAGTDAGFAQTNQFLSDRLNDPSRRERFLAAIFQALALYRSSEAEKYIRLTWASAWDSLEPFLDPTDPARWVRAVGVYKEDPAWLAVFKYHPTNVGPEFGIFRPTQYDAGWYAYHFPSPPQAALPVGGHTMFLHPGASATKREYGLTNEYLHRQIDFTIEHWRAGGGLIGYAGPTTGSNLEEQRFRHWLRLQRPELYGPHVADWMPDPNN